MRTQHASRPLARLGLGLVTAAASLALAACGSSGNGYGSSGSSSGTTQSANGATADALHTMSISLGTILVDAQGKTIYYFAGDVGSQSQCNGACAANWPPVPASASTEAISCITASLGSTTRADGSKQLTVDGHPVYTFAGDTSPGDATGQGKVLDGGLWTVVSPDGKAISASANAGGY